MTPAVRVAAIAGLPWFTPARFAVIVRATLTCLT
jgi:hypothetical protein